MANPTSSDWGRNAHGVLVASAVVTVGLGIFNGIANSHNAKQTGTPHVIRVRLFIGIAMVYILLGVTAEFAPQFAKGMALLIMTTAFVTEGGPALGYVLGLAPATRTPNAPPIPISGIQRIQRIQPVPVKISPVQPVRQATTQVSRVTPVTPIQPANTR